MSGAGIVTGGQIYSEQNEQSFIIKKKKKKKEREREGEEERGRPKRAAEKPKCAWAPASVRARIEKE